MARTSKKTEGDYLDKLNNEVQSNQSRLSLILGALIVLVIGILVFNYFNRNQSNLGPSQQTEKEEDVSPQNLPGKYTVKDGDTLFLIAQNYYNDGYKYTEIAKANNLENVDLLETGQVLEIPKVAEIILPTPPPQPTPTPKEEQTPTNLADGAKGAPDGTLIQEEWGPKITSTTYTVVAGDWLSKIAGRAYGDIFAYKKLAEVNNIPNPDLIYPGMILTIPR